MLLKQLFNAVCGIFLFTACGTTYYYADFIKPSDVYVPSSAYRVGLMNRGATVNTAAAIYVDGVPIEYIKELPKTVGDKTLDLLEKELKNLSRFELVEIPLVDFQIADRSFMRPPYSMQQADSICTANDIDGFVSIDGIDLSIKTSGEVNVVSAIDQNGMPVRVPEFTQEQTLEYNIAWRFYVKGQSEPIDVFDDTYRGYFKQTGYSPAENNVVANRTIKFDQVAGEAAFDYHNRISPYWEQDYRLYYRSEGVLSQISQNLEYNGNWESAASQWLKLTVSEDANMRYESKYNMAVASEMLGRPKLAKDWLEKAITDKPTKQAQKYMVILDKQILIYDVIDDQLGM